MFRVRALSAATIGCALLLPVRPVAAQASLPVFTDHLVNGFQDWSWGTRSFSNSSPVNSGTNSIRLTLTQYQALSFWHANLDTSLYTNISFWAHGGSSGGQRLQLVAEVGGKGGPAVALSSALQANTWKQYVVPLSALGAADKTNFNRLNIQLTSSTAATFYVDDVRFTAKPPPVAVHVTVSPTETVRFADTRWFGVNTAIWDTYFDTPTTISLMKDMGVRVLRFPGGSLSDEYHWASNKSGTNTWQWVTSFAKFVHVATNVGAQAFITVNYGSGTPAEAAGWVRHANVTNRLGFRYWEIGNECYGTWETDTNAEPHDAHTYAVRARDYIQQMKAADPAIKVGVVVAPGENSYDNGYTAHPVINPRTGQTNYGWTPILLTTLRGLGVTPDFLVHHHYPQWTAQESDPLLLQSTVNWAADAADLRQQLTDYFGTDGANIELVVTENNSNSGEQGRQSTSLVNGLYYADSFGRLARTEFNAFVWWDWRNGTDTKGSFDDLLYGWRTYGDLGMVNGLNTLHPTYYAAKLMKSFVQPGDRITPAASDFLLISTHAARTGSGAVSLLVLNKDPLTNFVTQINLQEFQPGTNATVRSYGIPQDEAARTNGPALMQDIQSGTCAIEGPVFNYSFPPLSLTLFTISPSAPRLVTAPASVQEPGKVVLELQGQPYVRYLLQSSRNLASWRSVSTNTLAAGSAFLTNAVMPGQTEFWRAAWGP